MKRASMARKDSSRETRHAFTLIEVLVSMAIITVIVLMVSNMFHDTSQAWDIGVQKSELTTAGRAAIEFMAREISLAVAGPIETAAGNSQEQEFNLSYDVDGYQDLRFIALSGNPETARALRGMLLRYKYDIYLLQTWRNTGADSPFNPYTNAPSWDSASTLLTNVTEFEISAYATTNDLWGPVPNRVTEYNSSDYDGRLPVAVDIFLEVLTEEDMKTAENISPDPNNPDRQDFIDRNAKSFSTRVYFPNRQGYMER